EQADDHHDRDRPAVALEQADHLVLAKRVVDFAEEHVLLRSITLRNLLGSGLGTLRTQGQIGRFLQLWNGAGLFSGWCYHFNAYRRWTVDGEAWLNGAYLFVSNAQPAVAAEGAEPQGNAGRRSARA